MRDVMWTARVFVDESSLPNMLGGAPSEALKCFFQLRRKPVSACLSATVMLKNAYVILESRGWWWRHNS